MQSAKNVGFPTKDAPVMDGQSGASNSAAIQCMADCGPILRWFPNPQGQILGCPEEQEQMWLQVVMV